MCLAFIGVQAQSLQTNIPKDATFVLTFNPGVLNSKVKFSKLKEFDFVQMGLKEMVKEAGPMGETLKSYFNDPSQLGIDLLSSFYVFGKVDGENIYMGMTAKMGDVSKFNALVDEYIAPMMPVQEKSGMKYLSPDADAQFAWNDKQLFFGSVQLEFGEEEEYTEFKNRKEKASTDWLNSIISNKPVNSIASHPKFKAANVNQDDVNFWVDYETFAKVTNEMQGQNANPMAGMMMGMMSGLYEDSYMAMRLNFDQGVTKFATDYFMNETMTDIYQKVFDGKFNEKFLKYLPKNNLGYFSFNMNVNNAIQLIKESENPMLAQYPVYEGMALEALKGMGIEMTADDLYKVWGGDMMFVVTGVKEFEKEVTTYEFDDDFNKKEVTKMEKQKFPEFTFLMSHGSKDNVLKFIDLAKQSSMISEDKGLFKVAVPDMPIDIFMSVKDDMLVVSNNKKVLTAKAAKLYSKSELMNPKEASQLAGSVQRIYWDIPGTMKYLEEMEDMDLDDNQKELFNMGKDSFKNLVIESSKAKGDSMNSTMKLNFTNDKMNSLEQIFGMINKVVMTMTGGSSM
jgi:hypothetical protein